MPETEDLVLHTFEVIHRVVGDEVETISVEAAYYSGRVGADLIEFKDPARQVVFAVHEGLLISIRRVPA